MLSQLNLRFPKQLIATLKLRAAGENISVNALAERFLDDGLHSATAGDEYLQLAADPDEALRQLYRQLILGQTFGTTALSRDTLRFLLELAHQGYCRGQGQMVSVDRLRVLLEITFALLTWQLDNQQPVDSHYLKGTFGFAGDDWRAESVAFLAALPPVISQYQAECLIRPLISRSFDLQTVPDGVLSGLFTTERLKRIFPLCMRAREWEFDTLRRFCEQARPEVAAHRETIEAGNLRFELHISGLEHGVHAGDWYEMPRLFLVISGDDFIIPFGWSQFSELLRILSISHHKPEALPKGYQGYAAMLTPRATARQQAIVGLDALRLYMPEDALQILIREMVLRCESGELSQTLDSLRCLYGDL